MAFFDEISKKITDVSQATIQKTKDMTDTMKHTSMISDEEKSIRANYAKLGEAYFNNNRNCTEGEYASIIAQINDSFARIEEHKVQIEEIKAANKCPSCGALVKADAAFCPSCGAGLGKVSIPESTALNICSKCGKPIKAEAAFCVYCGQKVDSGVDSAANNNESDNKEPSEDPVEK